MSATFTFDPVCHVYAENGIVLPSVTQLLNSRGLVCYDGIPREVLERKAEIGTAAHAACWYADEAQLDWRTVDPAVLPYVNAWMKFRAETDFVPRLLERRGISEMNGRRYGYTLDREGLLNGIPTLAEIKCTAAVEPSWKIQTAAYEHALFRLDGVRRKRLAVHLKPNGNYSLFTFTQTRDYLIFRVVLTTPRGWEKIISDWLESEGKVANHGNGSTSNYHD